MAIRQALTLQCRMALFVAVLPFSAAQSNAPGAEGACQSSPDFNQYESDINRTIGITQTPQECCDLCEGNPECSAWLYNPISFNPDRQDLCYLKSRLTNPFPTKGGITSGVRTDRGGRCHSRPSTNAGSCIALRARYWDPILPRDSNNRPQLFTLPKPASPIPATDYLSVVEDTADCCTMCSYNDDCMFYNFGLWPNGTAFCQHFGIKISGSPPPVTQRNATELSRLPPNVHSSYMYTRTWSNWAFNVTDPLPNLAPAYATDSGACFDQCQLNCDCKWWTFNSSSSECTLMGWRVGNGTARPGITSGVHMGPKVQFELLDLSVSQARQSNTRQVALSDLTMDAESRVEMTGTWTLHDTLYTRYNLTNLVIDVPWADGDSVTSTLLIPLVPGDAAELPIVAGMEVQAPVSGPNTEVTISDVSLDVTLLFNVTSCGEWAGRPAREHFSRIRSFLGFGEFCGMYDDQRAQVQVRATVRLQGMPIRFNAHNGGGNMPLQEAILQPLIRNTALGMTPANVYGCNPVVHQSLTEPNTLDMLCASTWAECCAACQAIEACVAWTFQAQNQTCGLLPNVTSTDPNAVPTGALCVLKSQFERGPQTAGHTSGLVRLVTSARHQCQLLPNLRVSGDVLESVRNPTQLDFAPTPSQRVLIVKNEVECCQVCWETEGCRAWHFIVHEFLTWHYCFVMARIQTVETFAGPWPDGISASGYILDGTTTCRDDPVICRGNMDFNGGRSWGREWAYTADSLVYLEPPQGVSVSSDPDYWYAKENACCNACGSDPDCVFWTLANRPVLCRLYKGHIGRGLPTLGPPKDSPAPQGLRSAILFRKQWVNWSFVHGDNATSAPAANEVQCAGLCRLNATCFYWTLSNETAYGLAPYIAENTELKRCYIMGNNSIGVARQNAVAGLELSPVIRLNYEIPPRAALQPPQLAALQQNVTSWTANCTFSNDGDTVQTVQHCTYWANASLTFNETLYTGYSLPQLTFPLNNIFAAATSSNLSVPVSNVHIVSGARYDVRVPVEVMFQTPVQIPAHSSIQVNMTLELGSLEAAHWLLFNGSGRVRFPVGDRPATTSLNEFQSFLGYGKFCGRFVEMNATAVDTAPYNYALHQNDPSWLVAVTANLSLLDFPRSSSAEAYIIDTQTSNQCNPELHQLLSGVPLLPPSCEATWQDCCASCNAQVDCMAWNYGAPALLSATTTSCSTSTAACALLGVLARGRKVPGVVAGSLVMWGKAGRGSGFRRKLQQTTNPITTNPVTDNFFSPTLLCNATEGVYWQGSTELRTREAASWRLCCELCRLDGACRTWSFVYRQNAVEGKAVGSCVLFNSRGTVSAANGVISGDLSDKTNLEGCIQLPRTALSMAPNTSLLAAPVIERLFNPAQCCGQCSKVMSCTGYQYNAWDGTCTLLTAFPGTRDAPGYTLGVLQGKQGFCGPAAYTVDVATTAAGILSAATQGVTFTTDALTWPQVCCYNSLSDCGRPTPTVAATGRSLLLPASANCLTNALASGINGSSYQECMAWATATSPPPVPFEAVKFLPFPTSSGSVPATALTPLPTFIANASECGRLCVLPSCNAFTYNNQTQACSLLPGQNIAVSITSGGSSYYSGVANGATCPSRSASLASNTSLQQVSWPEGLSWQEVCCFNPSVLPSGSGCRTPSGRSITLMIPCPGNASSFCDATSSTTVTSSGSNISVVALTLGIIGGVALGLLAGLLALLLYHRHRMQRAKRYNLLEKYVGPLDEMLQVDQGSLKRLQDVPELGGDKYVWREQVHRSENSIVIAGVQRLANMPVAAKFFISEYDFGFESRFYRLGLSPRLLPECYDIIETVTQDEFLYCIVLERGDYTLQQHLHRKGHQRPDLRSLKSILLHICECLDELHSANVVHGDVKPQNVMWFNQSHRWKLIDFATWHEAGVEAAPQYTLRYTAPEVLAALREDRPLTIRPAQDVWSLGVLAWEAFVGEPLFGNHYNENEVEDMLRGVKPLPFERHPALWLAIQEEQARELIHRLLRRDPGDRYTIKKVLDSATFKAADTTVMRQYNMAAVNEGLRTLLKQMDTLQEVSGAMLQSAVAPSLIICVSWEEVIVPSAKRAQTDNTTDEATLYHSADGPVSAFSEALAREVSVNDSSADVSDAPEGSFVPEHLSPASSTPKEELFHAQPSVTDMVLRSGSKVDAAASDSAWESRGASNTTPGSATGQQGTKAPQVDAAMLDAMAELYEEGHLYTVPAQLKVQKDCDVPVPQLRQGGVYVIRFKVMCGTPEEETPLPVTVVDKAIIIATGQFGREQSSTLAVHNLHVKNNSYAWDGYAMWRAPQLPLGPSDVALVLLFTLKAGGRQVQLQKRLPIYTHSYGAAVPHVDQRVSIAKLMQAAPSWAKGSADGITFFAQLAKGERRAAQ